MHTAVNWTTVLYIAAVVLLLEIVAGRSFLGWLFVLFIGSLAVIIFYQWKNRTEIELRKAVKIIWRISFLVYLLLYVLLVLAGIIQRILS
ncbi:DUF3397 family protein [Oceanobacillus massiliensis]|uniref:DUF3397 family protein n=1 Tax=Oceanobacillus massiliensis TaxID=1465765 RepID=UPI0009DACCF1|nr:DUF3397 family protein [Oceanobacillus massiliensis]